MYKYIYIYFRCEHRDDDGFFGYLPDLTRCVLCLVRRGVATQTSIRYTNKRPRLHVVKQSGAGVVANLCICGNRYNAQTLRGPL